MLKAEFQSTLKNILDEEKAALPSKTLKFWRLARCWNGVDDDPSMTVGKAMDQLRGIQSELNPQRPLNSGLEELKDNIIEHGTKAQQRKYLKSIKSTVKLARLIVL